jgi:hypothetical protein
MPSVEQHRVKRSGLACVRAIRDRALEGFTLFAPMSGDAP